MTSLEPSSIANKDSDASVRGRSTIEFPYLDLDSAIEVAQAVHNVGGTSCEWNQLAVQMKQSPKGGGFRLRLMTARSFGILNYDRGNVELTDLGIHILDPKHEKSARAESFLNVPLFKGMFEKMNGQVLPPVAAIERIAENLGVAPKQKDKARQVFMRSAKQAGYFDLDPERLTTPPNLKGNAGVKDTSVPVEEQKKENGSGRLTGSDDYHPFIVGLLQKLPSPETEWTYEGRVKWLSTAANIFDLLYTCDDLKVIELQIK